MFERMLVCGAGAIGGTIAAFLKRSGHPVTVADLAEDHVAEIRAEGLRITGPIAQFTVALDASAPDKIEGPFDLILLAVKAQHTKPAVDMIGGHLSPNGLLVSVQNGLNELLIADLIGRDRTMGCFINFGADYIAPGHIEFGGRGPLMLGELDGRMSERLTALHEIMRDFEPNAGITDNIFGYLWSKLAFGALLISQTLSNVPTEQFLDDPKYRPIIHRTVGDVARVARAEGIRMMKFQGFDAGKFATGESLVMDRAISDYAEIRRGSSKLYSGIWRDLAVRKRATEVTYQYEPILEMACRRGIAVPALAAAVGMIASVERGERVLSGGLADELLSIVQQTERKQAAI